MFISLTRGIKVSGLLPAVLLGASFALATLPAAAQEQMPTPTPVSEPLYKEYKGVSLGMSVEEARRALGEPKSKGTRQDFFVFSEKEMAQVFYRDGKVSALSVNYIGEDSGAPEGPWPCSALRSNQKKTARCTGSFVIRRRATGFHSARRRARTRSRP